MKSFSASGIQSEHDETFQGYMRIEDFWNTLKNLLNGKDKDGVELKRYVRGRKAFLEACESKAAGNSLKNILPLRDVVRAFHGIGLTDIHE
jgi:hypothetical protein